MREPPLDPRAALGLEPGQLPRHIAIIMDGNGRWARTRGQPRIVGHEAGARVVRDVVTHCARLGIEALTLYSFSAENWKRPRTEVDFLMDLYARYLVAERDEIMDNNIRFRQVGRQAGLPEAVVAELDLTTALSRGNTGLQLCLALNYGARTEITDAVRAIAEAVQAGRIAPADIDEATFERHLYTAGIADPDLLIRTAGESRLSNFLLWQISYAEFYVESDQWPDFTVDHLDRAIQDFARRDRRFGGLTHSPT